MNKVSRHALLLSLFFIALVSFPVTRARAASYTDEEITRVGYASLVSALENFGYVLPDPEVIESIGGLDAYVYIVGSRIIEQDWFTDVYGEGTLAQAILSPLFIPANLGRTIGELLVNKDFANEIFGLDIAGVSYPSDLDSVFQTVFDAIERSYSYQYGGSGMYAIGNGQAFGSYQKAYISGDSYINIETYSSSPKLYLVRNYTTATNYVWSPTGDYYIIYWGNPDLTIHNPQNYSVNIRFIQYGVPSESITFEASPSDLTGYYKYDYGNNSFLPGNIINYYNTIYNNFYNDNVKDALNLIYKPSAEATPQPEPTPKSVQPMPSGVDVGGHDFTLPSVGSNYLSDFKDTVMDFVKFVKSCLKHSGGIEYVFYSVLILGVMAGIIQKLLG